MIVNKLFEVLNNKFPNDYCVLRGYETLPDTVNNDIDFAVYSNCVDNLKSELIRFFAYEEYFISYYSDRFGFFQIYFSNGEHELKLDFWTVINFRGMIYSEVAEVIKNRKIYRNINVADEQDEFEISFYKELYHNKRSRNDKVKRLNILYQKCEQPVLPKFLMPYLNNNNTMTTLAYVSLILDLVLKNFHKYKIGVLFHVIKYFLKLMKSKKMKNFQLYILGIDGSGKSTLSNFLMEKFSYMSNTDVIYRHGRPGFIPNLRQFLFQQKIDTRSIDFSIKKHKSREHTRSQLTLYSVYYILDYLLERLKYSLKLRRVIFIYDRSWQDYFSVSKKPFQWRVLELFYRKLCTDNFFTLHLNGNLTLITKRKPELDQEHANRLNDAQICYVEFLQSVKACQCLTMDTTKSSVYETERAAYVQIANWILVK